MENLRKQKSIIHLNVPGEMLMTVRSARKWRAHKFFTSVNCHLAKSVTPFEIENSNRQQR